MCEDKKRSTDGRELQPLSLQTTTPCRFSLNDSATLQVLDQTNICSFLPPIAAFTALQVVCIHAGHRTDMTVEPCQCGQLTVKTSCMIQPRKGAYKILFCCWKILLLDNATLWSDNQWGTLYFRFHFHAAEINSSSKPWCGKKKKKQDHKGIQAKYRLVSIQPSSG